MNSDLHSVNLLPHVSVIVPARNVSKTIALCLEGLLIQDYPKDKFEIIVVDNSSSDDTQKIINKYPIIYINEERIGRAAARNAGVKVAQGEILAFIDADCIPSTNWITEMVKVLKSSWIGGVQSLVKVEREFENLTYDAESHILFHDFLPILDTKGCMFKRKSFDAVGGFDEKIARCEDSDLSWKVLLINKGLFLTEHCSVRALKDTSSSTRIRRCIESGSAMVDLHTKWSSIIGTSGINAFLKTLFYQVKLITDFPGYHAKLQHSLNLIYLLGGYFWRLATSQPNFEDDIPTNAEPTFRITRNNDSIIFKAGIVVEPGKIFFILLKKRAVFSTNGVGASIIIDALNGTPLDEAIASAATSYKVDLKIVKDDIDELFERMQSADILTIENV